MGVDEMGRHPGRAAERIGGEPRAKYKKWGPAKCFV